MIPTNKADKYRKVVGEQALLRQEFPFLNSRIKGLELTCRGRIQPTEHYTQFLGKCAEACQFEQDLALAVRAFPGIADWGRRYPLKLVEHAGDWSGLISVCAYLHEHGRPNCYLRELPIEVDTKFIERKRGVLAELIPILAPNCVGPDASSFEARFGFRQKLPLIRFRALDERLVAPDRMPFRDFAIPLDEGSRISIPARNVLVVENETTFPTPLRCNLIGSKRKPASVLLAARDGSCTEPHAG